MIHVKKIVVIGGESTGKSTLCEQLASIYKTAWVEEYARTYLENLNRPYVQDDLLVIAKGQVASEEYFIQDADRLLFCDTDLHVIKVWSEFKYGEFDPVISEMMKRNSYDGYILTSPDFPWKEDPLREHPEPSLREHFFSVYHTIVAESGLPYCIVKGNKSERMQIAREFIDKLLND